jgi:cobalt/nickel transport system permease protein
VDPASVPRLGVFTAMSFVLMMLTFPLPGGGTVHFTAVAVLALLFGAWTAFLCVSLVLLLHAGLLGAGGITSLGVSALVIGGVGSLCAVGVFRAIAGRWRRAAIFLAAWTSVVVPAAVMAFLLGLQPLIATMADGQPRFFPFGWEVVVPALVLPHMLLGVAEGMLTVFVVEAYERATGRPIR